MSRRVSSKLHGPTTTALVLALLLVIMGSPWPHVAGGVRTTPRASGPPDGGVLGDASRRSTGEPDRRTAASPEEEDVDDKGRPVAAEREELWEAKERRAATGSRLPDCAHACGPCSPCRRVMVSFMCAQASESCPVAYRCMCRGRFFRVPSL
ncbi:unnamed protein product [Urochloa humidicola]